MDTAKRAAIIAGNWKMNMTKVETKTLITDLLPLVQEATCKVVICVPFTNLDTAAQLVAGSNIQLGAQNCHWEKSGAFTGEISAEMLLEAGCSYVIVGHSERRQYFGETDQTVNQRLTHALEAGLKVILCVGESLEQRDLNQTAEVISRQLTAGLKGVTAEQLQNIVVAYEPIWAIGTGKTATATQAQEVCSFVRLVLSNLYSVGEAGKISVQYGGSMNAKNAKELVSELDIDGGLIGGASLKAADFAEIVKAASR